jgi:hypothetical protein
VTHHRPSFTARQAAIAIVIANVPSNDQRQGSPRGYIIEPIMEMTAIALTAGATAAIPTLLPVGAHFALSYLDNTVPDGVDLAPSVRKEREGAC